MNVQLAIWDDNGGDEKIFRALHSSSYYKGAHAIAICYDITDRISFSNVKNWFDLTEKISYRNIVIVIVGMKCDQERLRRVSKEEAKAFCVKRNLEYIEVSAKYSINIDKLFYTLANRVSENPTSFLPLVMPDIMSFHSYCSMLKSRMPPPVVKTYQTVQTITPKPRQTCTLQ